MKKFSPYCTKLVAHSPKGLNVDNLACNAGEINATFRNSEGVELVRHYFYLLKFKFNSFGVARLSVVFRRFYLRLSIFKPFGLTEQLATD